MSVQTGLNAMLPQAGWHPLSASQYAHLFMYGMRPSLRGYYNISLAARVEPGMDPEALARALDRVAARHLMLRTHFGEVAGRIMQRAQPQVTVPLSIIDIDSVHDAALNERVEADRLRPFDESTAPLLRASLYRAGPAASVLLLVADHLVCDGWSFWQLIEELGHELQAGAAGQLRDAAAAPEYFMYASEQPAWLDSAQGRRQYEYWEKTLAHPYPALQLAYDRHDPEVRDTVGLTFDAELTRNLRTLASRLGTSLFVTVLTSYFILLHRLTGQSRLAVGAPAPARSSQWSETVGSFSNPVVLRAEIEAGMSMAQLIEQLRSTVWRALKHQIYPLAEIVERLNPPRTSSGQPYFQTLFVFQNARNAPETAAVVVRVAGARNVQWGGFQLSTFDRWRSIGSVGLDLRLEALDLGDRLWVAMDYNAGRFAQPTMERHLQSLQRLLTAMAADADQSIDRWVKAEKAPPRAAAPGFKTDSPAADRERLLQLALAKGLKRKTAVPMPPLVATSRDGALPLSYAQQGMWLLAQLEGASAAYHMSGGIRLDGPLDRAVLLQALQQIVARHEALRTSFVRIGSQPVQRIAAAEGAFALVDADLSDAAEIETALQRAMATEVSAPFDLQRGPLIRGQLLRLSAQAHVLLVTMHHIVSDGWSLSVWTDELRQLYAAYVSGTQPNLRELPVQYADYAVWQREWLASGIGEQQGAYWKSTLSGAPAVLELPTDRPRPARQDFAGGVVPVRLMAQLSHSLKALSQRHGVTLYMTLLAGWALLLSRLSGQQEVVIGSPSANRRRPELEGLIGLFVNMLALRVDLAGSPTVRELLARVKAVSLGAQGHQDLPFEQVVELLQPVRSLAHAPLFQVMFAWQNTPQGRLELPGLRLSRLPSVQVTAQYDLSLSLAESGEEIEGSLAYATSVFDRSTVERYVGYWQSLLEAMVADEEQASERLPLLNAAQRQQILLEWNATQAEFPRQQCIHELIESQVHATPLAIALEFAGEQLSYAELNRRANRLAHHLRRIGVAPDSRVALCVERSVAMVVALLAILKAGGAYVPLDPSYPTERLAFMLKDSAPVALLIDRASRTVLQQCAAEVNSIEMEDEQRWAAEPENDPPRPSVGLVPTHLAYVIYTSGSTGIPKGVMVEHGTVVNFLISMQHAPGMRATDRVLALTSLSFDIAALELYLPLISGARLILGARADATDAKRLDGLLQRHEITVLQGTPAMWRLLLAGRWSGREGLTALCGGEALSRQLSSQLVTRVGRLWNLYGPTETTIWSSATVIEPQADDRQSIENIGRPIANTQIYILDGQREPVGIGMKGEIYIAGAGVARGYLNRPELTAERFVRDLFNADPTARMYRTGDLGRWRPDGSIEFLGRNDHQVKIRGFNIELGEIEAQLRRHAQIADVVVVAREESGREKRLVAYYVGEELSAHALRSHVAAAVPQYMVPATYVRMPALPLTPNGKLDRSALPAPQREALPQQHYEAPQGEIEAALVEIWQELLNLERVSRHDHFFELGGHSLSAVALQTRIKRLGVVVPMAALFQFPTVKALAGYILCGPVHEVQTDATIVRGSAPGESIEDTILMREGNSQQRPLFLVHELTGEVQPLFPLANALDESIPVIGLALTDSSHLESVERLAAQHVQALRRVQPQGPYRVAGHSFGGVVAYEIAHQLLADDEAVEFVGLIDCYRPTKQLSAMFLAEQNITEVALLAILVNFLYPFIEPTLLAELEQITDLDAAVERAKHAGLLPPELAAEQIRRWTRNWRASHAAMALYNPPTLPIDVHQFLADDVLSAEDDSRGWSTLLGDRLRSVAVGGSHFTIIMQPTVKILALQMSGALQRSERAANDAASNVVGSSSTGIQAQS